MAYEIRYTDFVDKGSIVVEDKSINQDTSLDFPGKQSTAYGRAIAENFLHLLENFASTASPLRPVEGQLWYDTTTNEDQLKIYDGTQWAPAGGVKRSNSEPVASASSNGDLWVDKTNQQLYLFNGTDWILIGPEASSGALTGIKSEIILDIADKQQTIFTMYVKDNPIVIISDTEFVPKRSIPGFSRINAGVTLINSFKFYGVSSTSENLRIANEDISAERFIRGDVESTVSNRFNIRSNRGIRIGEASQFEVALNNQTVEMKHNISGSGIDFVLRDQTQYNTVLRIDSQRVVGINNPAPEESLDVKGNIKISPLVDDSLTGNLIIDSTVNAIDIESGSIVTAGGIGIAQDVFVGGTVNAISKVVAGNIEPYVPSDQINISGRGNIGTLENRFNQLNVNTVNATTVNVTGSITGNLEGTASRAQSLSTPISLNFAGGDISGTTGNFDGRTAISDIELFVSNGFISNKSRINNVLSTDEILVNKVDTSDGTETGIYKVSKFNFLKTIPTIPIGSMLPFGGYTPPTGWLICDGSIVNKVDFNNLWQVVQHNFRDPVTLPDGGVSTFALPDFRGRMPVGLDAMGSQGVADRNPDALDIGNTGGSAGAVINEENLPEHEHNLQGVDGSQYYGIRIGSEENLPDDAISLNYETGDKGTQGLSSSGGIKTAGNTGVPLDIMNPFLATTIIIYAGE